jgi:hypothetical protein
MDEENVWIFSGHLEICDKDAEVPGAISNDNITSSHPTHFEKLYFTCFYSLLLLCLFTHNTSVCNVVDILHWIGDLKKKEVKLII